MKFLEKGLIRSVIIHEYVGFSGVGTCLAFVVEGAPDLAVCFAVRNIFFFPLSGSGTYDISNVPY
jgi:hypothetical protein